MSFADCVEDFVRTGRFTRQVAEELYGQKSEILRRMRQDSQQEQLFDPSIEQSAVELVTERMRQKARHQKYKAALAAIRNNTNGQHVHAHSSGETAAVQTKLTRDIDNEASWPNVDTETDNIKGQAHAKLAEGLSELRTRWLGFSRDNEMLEAVIHELHGKSTGNAKAAKFAKEWAQVAEDLRLRFNRAGGSIPFRKDWGSPQNHDSLKVAAVGKEQWINNLLDNDLLDVARMTDIETGVAFTPEGLREVLSGVYDTISTNGASDMIPGGQGGRSLSNRRQDHRFLIFKDSDAWMSYQKEFGETNKFATLMGHIDSMSRDIALMEILGPNPDAGFRYLQDIAEKFEKKPTLRAKNQAAFNLVSGTGDRNKSAMMADITGAIMSFQVQTKLGGAALSAISDQGFSALTLHWNGLSFIKFFHEFLDQLNPASEASRIMATRSGISALSMTDAYSNIGRFSELGSPGSSSKLGKVAHTMSRGAEVLLRGTGLSAITDGARRAFAVQYSSELAMNFGKRFDEIEPKFRRGLAQRGMTEADWELLRTTPTTDYKGARFFTVDQLMERTDITQAQRQHLASRVQTALNQELTHAVPEPDAAARIYTTGGMQRGTIGGDTVRMGTQFKSFSVSVLSTHWNRVRQARRLRGPMGAAAYLAEAVILTTMLGYVAMQLKGIAYGRNPRKVDPDDPQGAAKILAASFLQGGGSGIIGDVFFSDVNRFGGGTLSTMAGPTAGVFGEVERLTLGNLQELMQGEDTDILAESINFAKHNQPGGNIWFTRLLVQREIYDQLALWADPKGARRQFKRSEKFTEEIGSDYWWRPGERTPDNAPDLELIE